MEEYEIRKIKPALGSGFRDYLPEDTIPRQRMLRTIRNVLERFGYVPLETPGIEREEVLTGKDPSFSMQIFRIAKFGGESDLALRFDLTVPLARVVAAYPEKIAKPFKRYQVGRVWRGEKPQAGRFREFTQFDADIVGTPSVAADAEIVALMYTVMTELGFAKFLIRVNNRKILNGLPSYVGFPEAQINDVLRILDKLDKFGWEQVKKELSENADGKPLLSKPQTEQLKQFIDIQEKTPDALLARLEQLMGNIAIAAEGIEELRQLARHLQALGVPADKWTIDLSVARGLGYYTGPVFETVLTNLPEIGSVFSGGRYDGLVARFSNAAIPATGASVGVDRLFAAMEKLGMVATQKSTADVIVLNFDSSCTEWLEEIAAELRRNGIKTDFYLGQETTLKGQLTYAIKQEVPFVIIAGPDEQQRGVVQLRDTKEKKQQEVAQKDLLATLKKLLA